MTPRATSDRSRQRDRLFTAAKLRAWCKERRPLLASDQLATEDELALHWPGGKSNPYRGHDAWIWCHAQYTRFFGRQETRQSRKLGVAEQLAAVVHDAQSRTPIPVPLSIGERAVYPKSDHALRFLDALDATIDPIVAVAFDGETPPEFAIYSALAKSLAWRTWAWILTHPGVRLPFNETGGIEPPAWTLDLVPEDFLAIYVAHRELHSNAVQIMAEAFPPEPGQKSRLGLSGFLGSYASENGIRPSRIMRQWSLPEVYAAAISNAETHRVAHANAEEKAKREGKRS